MPKSSNAIFRAAYTKAFSKAPIVLAHDGIVYGGYGLTKTEMMEVFHSGGWQPDDHHIRWKATIDTWAKLGLVKRVEDVTFVFAGERANEMASKWEQWWWASNDARIVAIRAETGPGTVVEAVI